MSHLMKALRNKVHSAEKKVEKAGKKLANTGGNIIANYVATSPTAARYSGIMADKKRQAIIRKRESRANDKAMGY